MGAAGATSTSTPIAVAEWREHLTFIRFQEADIEGGMIALFAYGTTEEIFNARGIIGRTGPGAVNEFHLSKAGSRRNLAGVQATLCPHSMPGGKF